MQVLIHPTVWMHFLGMTKMTKIVMVMVLMNDNILEVIDASTGHIDNGGIFWFK